MGLPCLASDWDESPTPVKKNEPAEATGSSSTNGNKFILHGQVQHSDKLPALGQSMQAGSNFNPNSIPQAKYASSWFKIPRWFAGTFESHASTIEYMKDYVSGRASRPHETVSSFGEEMYGYQQDSHGDIWHFYVKSGSSKTEQEGHITVNNIDWYGPELVSEERVVLRILATSLIVDKRSGIIVDSFRREDLKTYEPIGNGVMRVSYTSKSFDSHGLPRDLQNGVSLHRRSAPFQPINGDGRTQDYRQMFKDYLSNEGLSQLSP